MSSRITRLSAKLKKPKRIPGQSEYGWQWAENHQCWSSHIRIKKPENIRKYLLERGCNPSLVNEILKQIQEQWFGKGETQPGINSYLSLHVTTIHPDSRTEPFYLGSALFRTSAVKDAEGLYYYVEGIKKAD